MIAVNIMDNRVEKIHFADLVVSGTPISPSRQFRVQELSRSCNAVVLYREALCDDPIRGCKED